MEQVTCLNCANTYVGNYCPQCGQSAHEHRINAQSLLHDIPHSVFHVDKGFFHTLVALFTHPGKMLEEYLAGRRAPHFRPFAYVILMSTLATILMKGIRFLAERYYLSKHPGGHFPEVHGFFSHYISAFIFLTIPITALVCWIFLVHKKYNYWEHVVINTYLAAQINIILVLVKLVGLIYLLFTDRLDGIDMTLFITIFLTGVLVMYGFAYGYLMKDAFKQRWKLVLILVAINFLLVNIYLNGFVYAGVNSPW